jgi:hypothetical protein
VGGSQEGVQKNTSDNALAPLPRGGDGPIRSLLKFQDAGARLRIDLARVDTTNYAATQVLYVNYGRHQLVVDI